MANSQGKDRRLIKEESMLVIPSLATAIGLNEAIILQQVHYWLTIAAEKGNNFKDGYYWTYNSIRQWQEQFPWWSKNTIRRTLDKLEAEGLLVIGCYNKLNIDRTKWYRIDYDALSRFAQNGQMDLPKMGNPDLPKMGKPLPDTSLPNNSTYTTGTGGKPEPCPLPFNEYKSRHKINEYAEEVIEYYLRRYKEVFGKEHVSLKPSTWEQVALSILHVDEEHGRLDDIDPESLKDMIDHYFDKAAEGKYKAENFCITHFNNSGIKKVNFYEAAY